MGCNFKRRQRGAFMLKRIAAIVVITLSGPLACTEDAPTGGGPVGLVEVGPNIEFTSAHNGSQNPAVDTVAVGEPVTWRWSGNLVHSVRSTGIPIFTSSGVFSGSGSHVVTFTNPGTYEYDCSVHGFSMTGRVVVR